MVRPREGLIPGHVVNGPMTQRDLADPMTQLDFNDPTRPNDPVDRMRSRVGPRQAFINALVINRWLTETWSGERLRFRGKKSSFPWILALENHELRA